MRCRVFTCLLVFQVCALLRSWVETTREGLLERCGHAIQKAVSDSQFERGRGKPPPWTKVQSLLLDMPMM
jgi:hypothetical protein